MAERKAQNKYYPPDWTPADGSINKFRNKHKHKPKEPKKAGEGGFTTVRFEMPYNIWCLGCEKHIAQGVRYNAQKKAVGEYYSTTIWSFRFKCHLCPSWIEIQTDPRLAIYTIKEGAKKKEEDWDPEENGTYALPDRDEKDKLAANPFYKLEKTAKDAQTAQTSKHAISNLLEVNEKYWTDPYTLNSALRKRLRGDKKKAAEQKAESHALRDKHSLLIDILPISDADVRAAQNVQFHRASAIAIEDRKAALCISSIFNASFKDSPKARLMSLAQSGGFSEDIPLTPRSRKEPGKKALVSLCDYNSE